MKRISGLRDSVPLELDTRRPWPCAGSGPRCKRARKADKPKRKGYADSAEYAMRKLRREDRPDIYARILAGELSSPQKSRPTRSRLRLARSQRSATDLPVPQPKQERDL
jgi:hypothetical protein